MFTLLLSTRSLSPNLSKKTLFSSLTETNTSYPKHKFKISLFCYNSKTIEPLFSISFLILLSTFFHSPPLLLANLTKLGSPLINLVVVYEQLEGETHSWWYGD